MCVLNSGGSVRSVRSSVFWSRVVGFGLCRWRSGVVVGVVRSVRWCGGGSGSVSVVRSGGGSWLSVRVCCGVSGWSVWFGRIGCVSCSRSRI